jgi:hypothetical protein
MCLVFTSTINSVRLSMAIRSSSPILLRQLVVTAIAPVERKYLRAARSPHLPMRSLGFVSLK